MSELKRLKVVARIARDEAESIVDRLVMIQNMTLDYVQRTDELRSSLTEEYTK